MRSYSTAMAGKPSNQHARNRRLDYDHHPSTNQHLSSSISKR